MNALQRTVEAMLFLAPEPVSLEDLASAAQVEEYEVHKAMSDLREHYDYEGRGLVVREVAGGYTLATHPDAEPAARRLLETLAIVAYLQPVSRPEVARIRGVNSESATATLLERGVIEEAGRSQFGAVLYRTTPLFLKLFGLQALSELPDVAQWDPSPEEQAELRDRLLRAGEARAGTPTTG